jgi:NAD(P)-dependent dehydrogenase (short-subunit alcohol dehydrogenase family)
MDRASELVDRALQESLDIRVIEMDVSNADSVTASFSALLNDGPIDLLVNNAGISGSAPLENTPEDEHKAIFETNYFGLVRCIQAVVGSMRERGVGCIVNISSAAGLFATPTQIPYSASKWAVECLTEALAFELKPFGIRVVCIEPGVVQTSIFKNSAKMSHFDKHSPYAPAMRRIGKLFAAGLKHPSSAEQVAATIIEAITTATPKLRWPVGNDAQNFYDVKASGHVDEWIDGAHCDEEAYIALFHRLYGIQL